VRILAVADAVSPFVYSSNFPGNLPPFDVVLSAGDTPGHVLEFIATKTTVPPVYVFGNHAVGYLRDPASDEERPPGGCIDAHLRVVEVGGLLIAGIEGSLRYRQGPHQYTQAEFRMLAWRMAPRLAWLRATKGRAVDVLLTHAPPRGPHEGDDHVHAGVDAFNAFHLRWRPRVHVHGHVHLVGSNAPRSYVTEDGVRVVNAYEFALVDL